MLHRTKRFLTCSKIGRFNGALTTRQYSAVARQWHSHHHKESVTARTNAIGHSPIPRGNYSLPVRSTRKFHETCSQRQRWTSGIGAEPGIDPTAQPRKPNVSEPHSYAESEIKIVDYSAENVEQHDVTSEALESFLQGHPRPQPSSCRWIYVNGLNWDVIRRLGVHDGLHRLAIEDVLDTSSPAKADFYDTHCFMEMTLQKLVRLGESHPHKSHTQSTESAAHFEESTAMTPNQKRDKWHTFVEGRFGMSVEQVSLFLTADNTVITIFEKSGSDVFSPIMNRLQSPQTVLRSSNDASMLVHAVIDVVVDLSLPIGKAVSNTFGELEDAVLTKPTIAQSKQLYVLRSGLAHLMENIIATNGLIKVLCDHRAVDNVQDAAQTTSTGAHAKRPLPSAGSVTISPTAQVYLQDVQDHVQTLSNSTHMSIRSAENLTSLIFNTIAASQNESVRSLTLVSSFFLPLTFLTGYFGMNFENMPIIAGHSDAYFWYIATPIMLTMGLLMGIRSRRSTFKWMGKVKAKQRTKT